MIGGDDFDGDWIYVEMSMESAIWSGDAMEKDY